MNTKNFWIGILLLIIGSILIGVGYGYVKKIYDYDNNQRYLVDIIHYNYLVYIAISPMVLGGFIIIMEIIKDFILLLNQELI